VRAKQLLSALGVVSLTLAACGDDEPGAGDSVASSADPTSGDTAAEDTEPASTEPASTEPGSTDPASTEPTTAGSEAPPTTGAGELGEVTTGPGVTDSEIRVAVLNDFSGPIASIGTPAAIGSEIYFEALNAEGGVCGRDVTVVRADTKYDTQIAIQEYRAIKDDTAFVTQLLGTATVFALANDVSRDGIVTLAGTLSASVIPLDHMFVFQTPFPLEAINAMAWVSDEMGGGENVKVGVIYQGDAYGEEGLAAIEYAAEALGNIDVVETATYSPTDEDFTAQVTAMQDAGAEVVWLHDTPRQTGGILGIAAQQGFDPLFMSNSAGFASALVEPLGPLLENYRVVNSNASWGEEGEEMDAMLAAVEEYSPDQAPDNWLVTGWISGMVTRAALERACEMGDLSREGITAAMEGLEVDLNGIAPDISFGSTPDERIPGRAARVNEIDLDSTLPVPITDYLESEPALEWALPEG
jgi:ABC-type branched-subunit amino acid transport system substrate-binding protein